MEGANIIGQWGPVFASTGCVAHWCIIGHCVGVMAAHGVSLGVVFATSHPTPPHRPSHPLPLLSILTAERDSKKYLEIQPSETEKVSYSYFYSYLVYQFGTGGHTQKAKPVTHTTHVQLAS